MCYRKALVNNKIKLEIKSNFQVHLQTQQEGKISIVRSTVGIIRKQGILALYNGLSASLLRQLTYSTIRFGVYEVGISVIYILCLCA